MIEPEILRQAILDRLSTVIDPETGVDVIRMRLIEDLKVNRAGEISYKFRPSSPLCPIAVPLSMAIKLAIDEVEGVTRQEMEIVGYIQAEEFTELFRNWMNEQENRNDTV